ncbi:uroporphyrinogen-III synthase [Hydromonas duriensis]|uniref:Uroporphyrinogen-III synthase n=1 Tax=Hydromonas duriensis TaxID=1527608 RepID=A0A4R6Y3P9_9BURK|nr:uroporphyrinogen-III synthase [Hydromonas duriensis]TDR31144.1 uroporphyrinogen-III synthase [Hydromonas duriensis]
MRTVVLTRPQPVHDGVSSFLSQRHVPLLSLPTLHVGLRIHPEFESHLQHNWNAYHGVMFVSQHAVQFAAQRLQALNLNWRTELWAAAVGQTTAVSVQRAWPHAQVICPAVNEMPDSERLWSTLQSQTADWASQRVLIVRAQNGRDAFLNWLRGAGATVDVWSCYQRENLSWSELQYHAFVSALHQTGVVLSITSQEGLNSLLNNLQHLNERDKHTLLQQPVLTLHPSIATHARKCGFVSVHVAPIAELGAHLAQLA